MNLQPINAEQLQCFTKNSNCNVMSIVVGHITVRSDHVFNTKQLTELHRSGWELVASEGEDMSHHRSPPSVISIFKKV